MREVFLKRVPMPLSSKNQCPAFCPDKKRGSQVVDLAKDPVTAEPSATSTTPGSKYDKASGISGCRIWTLILLSIVLSGGILSGRVQAFGDNWPQFRGADANAVSTKPLPLTWADKG